MIRSGDGMRAATLFSGIGAPEVAMPSWRWLWHAEIEPFPAAVMATRHPQSVNLGDVTADDFCDRALRIGRPDALVFGSPCQSFSIAGRRLGLDDPRGNLAIVALGIVARLKPTWFAFENVPGLLSSANGRDFGLFLRAVDECGYSGVWRLLDAQYAGVAQRRNRLFLVGHADWRRAAAVLLEPDRLSGYPPTRRETRQDITCTISSRPSGGGGLGTDFDLSGGVIQAYGGGNTSGLIAAAAVNAGGTGRIDFESETLITHALRADSFDAGEDGTGRGTPIVPVAFDWQSGGSKQRTRTRTRTSALSANQTPAVFDERNITSKTNWTRVEPGAPAGTLHASPFSIIGAVVRRLTPTECERLQGFPDNYTAVTYRGKPAKDGPRYKAISNSMAVPVMRWILERIAFVDGLS